MTNKQAHRAHSVSTPVHEAFSWAPDRLRSELANAIASVPQAHGDEPLGYKLDRREIDDAAGACFDLIASRPTPTAEKADVVEAVALAMANYDAAQVDAPLLASVEDFRQDVDRQEYMARARAAIAALQSRPAEPAGDEPEAWCFDVSSAPEDIELLVYRHDKPSPWSYGYRAVAMKSEGLWFGEDGDEIPAPAAWTRLADIPRSPSAPDLIAAKCLSAPNGRHQVDTSMESGQNNCFHCEAPMPALSAPALDGEKGE